MDTLKDKVLAKALDTLTDYTFGFKQPIANGVNLWRHHDRNGFSIDRLFKESPNDDYWREFTVCRFREDTPSDSPEWWIAAKLLDVPTETTDK